VKRPRKVRAFNRVQPQMTEEDQRRQQFISPSKHKLNPYLMMHFTRTEQYIAGSAIPPWGTPIVYMNGLNSTAAFGVPSITAAAACDIYYNSTSLILPMNGANGSTTFTDSSPSPKTVTRNGNTQISTTQSKFGGASAYFDGTGDYLTIPYTTVAFDWWTTDFTLEYWVYANDLSTFSFSNGTNVVSVAIANAEPGAPGVNYWSFGPISTGVIRFYYFTGSQNVVSSTQTISINTWNHVALVKNSSGINIFVNGVGLASPVAISGTPQSSASYPLIMGQINNRSMNGYIDDVRITKGVARYTSNFTVPTSANPTVVCT